MAEQVNFRSAFRGFNRTDVVRHLEFLNNSHEYKLNQLHTEIEELRAELTLARQLPSRSIKLEAELEAAKARCTELENQLETAGIPLPEQDNLNDYCAQLEAKLADAQQRLTDAEAAMAAAESRAAEAETASAGAQQRIDELESSFISAQPDLAALDAKLTEEKQRSSDLDTALSASQQRSNELEAALTAAQQRIAELEADLAAAQQRSDELQAQLDAANASVAQLEQDLANAQTVVDTAPVVSPDLEAQELAAYRRAERVERMALARARDIATQASGVLHDATARVDEEAVELSEMFDALSAQFDRFRERMLASKSTLRDAVTAMHTISTEEDVD